MLDGDLKTSRHEDVLLAQKICDALRADNKNAILDLYNLHHPFFKRFVERRLFSPDRDKAETVLTDFWVELLNAKAICGYEGRASLRTYLLTILRRRIIDQIRKNGRSGELHEIKSGQDVSESDESIPSPEESMLDKERRQILSESLMMLSFEAPKDALLVKMYLEDLTYRQMAERELPDGSATTKLDRKANAIKKQMTRKEYGSFVKFEVCLRRCIEKRQMKFEDLFD